ncbi:DUF192 domain-containing protein [Hyphomonas sp.]|jgi:uncharacterized membrane protein (UPF0127 family)|uniref:DUF192 domain-containing protein n=1 Tax=Hyphomonas sp. TaxID=87 RepID=UPI000C5A1287|nr:DUF192 domain-containing protein [Hyphomonas sp.]MAB10348.1 hypothetical protein [Hyphomonas sp.]MAU65387.1 hypothetical protein [Hyphomonas sp.]
MKRFLVSGMAAFALVLSAPAALAELETSPLTIESANGAHAFTVEIADEPEEITTGLMNRESMDPDAGMLFDFGQPREAAMWMKNTLIPLDMLFMDPQGKVIAIARETVPGSLRTITPGVPVKSVLELNGGRAEELGIEPGDEVIHPIFGNADE